jgi:2-keto-4-pentenoate hydratase/2-oxohepta-3-ene-1,7-dioic acid hydratase in catechol pathway
MRLLTYERGGARRLGAWVDGIVVDVPDAVGHPAFPRTMEELVAHNGGTTLVAAREALRHPDVVEEFGVARPHLLAALLPRAVCEFGPVPDMSATPAPLLAPDDVLRWPRGARGMECRVELGFVLGRSGRELTPRQAGRTLFGTTVMVTWSSVPSGGSPHEPDAAPGRRTAISLGPAIVTIDEPDPEGALVQVLVGGDVRAEAVLERGQEPFARLVAEASRVDEVGPGDVFGGGGFGAVLVTPLRRADRGSVIEVSVRGVGTLRARLAAA